MGGTDFALAGEGGKEREKKKKKGKTYLPFESVGRGEWKSFESKGEGEGRLIIPLLPAPKGERRGEKGEDREVVALVCRSRKKGDSTYLYTRGEKKNGKAGFISGERREKKGREEEYSSYSFSRLERRKGSRCRAGAAFVKGREGGRKRKENVLLLSFEEKPISAREGTKRGRASAVCVRKEARTERGTGKA